MNFQLAAQYLQVRECVKHPQHFVKEMPLMTGNAIHLISKHRKLCKSTSYGGKPRARSHQARCWVIL
jgi:hypothetical protein